ncbi:hypothetical protein QTI66_31730 [Variovorax sp. J22R133]|uniref:hypothetical protein n=1 Tax=Variovorax brevis TaxID=3053503 RepID=UPI00257645EE|nr:hypothetical protein [Variovorax sp. J22R133]MDM0116711.1 hypothetical protein [Variovorax sp. J22R133]
MQTICRVINIILSPILTLMFASRFAGLGIAGRAAGDAVGGVVAGLLVLAVELGLTQGPKYSVCLRRWLDPRAAFEGIWLQDVLGGDDNALGVFSLNYERENGSFTSTGHAYSTNRRQWAKWHSTHMFIDKQQHKATYRWEGGVLGSVPIAESDKSGLTVLDLRKPPTFSLPMTGDGEVFHVGEERRIKFRLRRVTKQFLKEFSLPFTMRDLRIDAHDEESQLVGAFFRMRKGSTRSPLDRRSIL